jgi:hypothetical protein
MNPILVKEDIHDSVPDSILNWSDVKFIRLVDQLRIGVIIRQEYVPSQISEHVSLLVLWCIFSSVFLQKLEKVESGTISK